MTDRPTSRTRIVVPIALAVGGIVWWWYSQAAPKQPLRDAQSIYQLAQSAIERDDASTARRLLQQCLELDPTHVEGRLYYGQYLRDAGDTDGAVELWRSIQTGTNSERAIARYLEGSVAIEQQRVDLSRDLLQESLRLNPSYLPAWEKLLSVERLLRKPDALLEALVSIEHLRLLTTEELVLRTIPSHSGYSIEETLPVLENVLRENPTDIETQLALAKVWFASGDAERTVEFFQQNPALAEENEEFKSIGILALLDLNKISQATALCDASHLPEETHETLLFACGKLAAVNQNWIVATDLLSKAFEQNQNHQQSCFLLGTALQRLGEMEAARKMLSRSVLLDNLNRFCLRMTQVPAANRSQTGALAKQIATTLEDLERFREAGEWYFRAYQVAPDQTELLAKREQMRALTENAKPTLSIDVPSRNGTLPTIDPKPSIKRDPLIDNPDEAEIKFVDVGQQVGLDFQYFTGESGFQHLIESMGGGAIVLDYDNDGWPDLYFPQGCKIPYDSTDNTHRDRLYRNRRGERFEDVTERAGLGSNRYGLGGTAWDYDNDGDQDLFVSNFGRNDFYQNNGDGTFSSLTAEVGMFQEEMSTSVAAADFNNDGLLDLYVAIYVSGLKVCPQPDGSYQPCDPAAFEGQPDRLFLNDGVGGFEDVSTSTGIALPDSKGLGVIAADLDDDGRMDLYVANDGVPNFLFRNATSPGSKELTFEELGLLSGTALDEQGRPQAGMGIALADFDGNTLLDLYVTNFYEEHNALYLNRGELLFADNAREADLIEPTLPLLGFGSQARDFDNDGDADLVVANGHIRHDTAKTIPWKMTAQFFRNRGHGTFRDISAAAGEYFKQQNLGRAIAVLDWNGDAREDLVIVHQNRSVALLENRSSSNRPARPIRLIGTNSNRDGVGAKLRRVTNSSETMRQLAADGGYLACNSRLILLPSMPENAPLAMEITWPSGEVTERELPGYGDEVSVISERFFGGR